MRSEMISLRSENSRILTENVALKRYNEKLFGVNRELRHEIELHLEIDQLAISDTAVPTVPNMDIFSRALLVTDVNNNEKETDGAAAPASPEPVEKSSFDKEMDAFDEELARMNERDAKRAAARASNGIL